MTERPSLPRRVAHGGKIVPAVLAFLVFEIGFNRTARRWQRRQRVLANDPLAKADLLGLELLETDEPPVPKRIDKPRPNSISHWYVGGQAEHAQIVDYAIACGWQANPDLVTRTTWVGKKPCPKSVVRILIIEIESPADNVGERVRVTAAY